ncbi:EKC/KEOPS complex subunit Tp53rkb-like [Diadema setosum]|uniref:EKC/KEOPS complex subunit Tp53rkb-like n=1 Tax=Diadema setosum TaxID=31175 RepID=UPI003B3BC0E1
MASSDGAKLIKQGAEARIYHTTFMGKGSIVKERFKKTYRHPTLDAKLSQKRTGQEVRTIMKCRKAGIATPVVYFVDTKQHSIHMEYVEDSQTVREYIQQLQKSGATEEDERLLSLASKMGKTVAAMHAVDVVHGDLTTSNMLLRQPYEDSALVMIDFGLSQTSHLWEDKGVDLYVLERALLSTHPNTEKLFQAILDAYTKNYKKSSEVMKKLEEVRQRGRKRVMVG